MKSKVQHEEALSQAKAELEGDDLHDRLLALGREDQIEQLLNEIKVRNGGQIQTSGEIPPSRRLTHRGSHTGVGGED